MSEGIVAVFFYLSTPLWVSAGRCWEKTAKTDENRGHKLDKSSTQLTG